MKNDVSLFTPTDNEIIALFRARDERALAEVRRKYGKHLYSLAFNVLRSAEDAEECLDDALFSVWRSFPEGEVCLPAYLSGVTRRAAIDRYRHETRKSAVPSEITLPVDELYEELHSPGADEEFFERETAEAISGFLRALDIKRRRVLLMRYYSSMRMAEIAEKTGVTVSAVEKSLNKTKKQLKAYLLKRGITV